MYAQGLVDAAGVCCYGTVDTFGVCNGWDASGQIAVTLLAASASLASTSAVAGYLGTSTDTVQAVTTPDGCVVPHCNSMAVLTTLLCFDQA